MTEEPWVWIDRRHPRAIAAEKAIEAAKTPRGAWTRAQIEAWGIKWPPKKGWKSRIIARHVRTGEPLRVAPTNLSLFE